MEMPFITGKSRKSPDRLKFSVKLSMPSFGTTAMLIMRGRFMVSLAIVSLLAGAVLGWWFTIPVLLLATFLALAVVAGVGVAVTSLWWIALDIFVVTLCLQLGYVAGSALETYTAFRGQGRALRESGRAASASSRSQRP